MNWLSIFNPAKSLFARIFFAFWAVAMMLLLVGAFMARSVFFSTEIRDVSDEQLSHWSMLSRQVVMQTQEMITNNPEMDVQSAIFRVTEAQLMPIITLNDQGEFTYSMPPQARPDEDYLRLVSEYTSPIRFTTAAAMISGPFQLQIQTQPDASNTLSSEGEYTLFFAEPRPMQWLFTSRGLLPIGMLGLAIGISGIVCFSLVYSLTKPLNHIKAKAMKMQRGDFNTEVETHRFATTDIQQISETLSQTSEKILKFVRHNEQLLADISHEIRTPLTRQKLALDILNQSAQFKPEIIERIERENMRIEQMLATLLQYSKLQHQQSLSLERVSIEAFLNDFVDDMLIETSANQKTLVTTFNILPTEDADNPTLHPKKHAATAFIDVGLMLSTLENVARNAVKYATSKISFNATFITTPEGNQRLELTIEDDGEGVSVDELSKLAEPFYRADSSRSRVTGGIGLGLCIAKRAIDLQRGSLEFAQSNMGGLKVKICIECDGNK